MYNDETVLVLDNPTLLKTLWRPLDVCSWLVYFEDGMYVKRSIKILFHSGIVMLTSPSKFLTGTIFLHAHLQAVYYNCVKFHLRNMVAVQNLKGEIIQLVLSRKEGGHVPCKCNSS
jgi:hypothetical protein